MSPFAATRAARVFVPPRSTPMTRFPATAGGYDTSPSGPRGREAIPRVSRGARSWRGPARDADGVRSREGDAEGGERRRPLRRTGARSAAAPAALGAETALRPADDPGDR